MTIIQPAGPGWTALGCAGLSGRFCYPFEEIHSEYTYCIRYDHGAIKRMYAATVLLLFVENVVVRLNYLD